MIRGFFKLRWLAAMSVAAVALLLALAAREAPAATATIPVNTGSAKGLGQLTGLLPRENLVLESALQVDLSHETVRLPLYKGTANSHTIWFILTEASDLGLAHNSGLNYAPKLANIAIGCPDCVQTVTLDSPSAATNKFGPAVVDFQGEPDFTPTRKLVQGPERIPAGRLRAGRSRRPRLQPVHPDRRQQRCLQRADRGHRKRTV